MNPRFEAGLVYRGLSSARLWLAIDTSRLLTLRDETEHVTRPQKRWQWRAIRGLAVEELCEAWSVSCEAFDEIMARHMPTPAREKTDGRRRTPRTGSGENAPAQKPEDAEELVWRRNRTARWLGKPDRRSSE